MGKGFEIQYCTILSPTLFQEIWQINHKQFSVFVQSSPSSCSFLPHFPYAVQTPLSKVSVPLLSLPIDKPMQKCVPLYGMGHVTY